MTCRRRSPLWSWRYGASAGALYRSGRDDARVGETANLGQARLELHAERGEVGCALAALVLQRFRRREVGELLEDLHDPWIARRGRGVRRSARDAHDRLVEVE